MILCAVTDDISNHFERALSMAVSSGISQIELRTVFGHRFPFFDDAEFAMMQSALAQYEVKVAAVSLGNYRIGADKTPWAYLKQFQYSKILSMCGQLGAYEQIIFASDLFSPENERRDYLESARKFILRASKRGFAVSMRNSPTTSANSADEILTGLSAVGAEWVCWDPSAAACAGELDLRPDVKKLLPFLRNVYIRDFKHVRGGAELVPPGSGEMDIPLLLRELHGTGYQGRITIDTGCWETEEQFERAAEYIHSIIQHLQ